MCLEKPHHFNKAVPLALNRVEFKMEYSYSKSELGNYYISAQYVCSGGTQFQNKNGIGERIVKGHKFVYKNITCLGEEKWSNIPICV